MMLGTTSTRSVSACPERSRRDGSRCTGTASILRRAIMFYLCGLIVALQATTFFEWVFDSRMLWQMKAVVVGLVVPGLGTLVGMRMFPPRFSVVPVRVWAWNAVALFVFWAGGYFLTGWLGYRGEFMSLAIPLDHLIPFFPEWVFVYLTVYFVFLLPLFYLESRRQLVALDLAQVMALGVSYTMFLYCPVAIDRPIVEASDFATWTLSIVQGRDPPWNCFPSTHCVACTVATAALLDANPRLGFWAFLSTAAICVSTVMTRQHFVLDAAAGIVLGIAFYFMAKAIVHYGGEKVLRILGPDWQQGGPGK